MKLILFLLLIHFCFSLPTGCPSKDKCVVKPINLLGCDPDSFIASHQGCCYCAYLNQYNVATVGVGFFLDFSSFSEKGIALIGLDYSDVILGKQCLNITQVVKLLNYTLDQLSKDTQLVLPIFDSLCCNVQTAVLDLVFNGGNITIAFPYVAEAIAMEQWDAAAKALLLEYSGWCNANKDQCKDDYQYIEKGCPCSGQYPSQCTGSACCTEADFCCLTLGWDNAETWMCCDTANPTCCGLNQKTPGCCGAGYPVCCPNLAGCCAAGYPVCCVNNNGCCEAGYPVCCPNGCCPSNYPVCCPNLCCPSGTTCSNGQCLEKNGRLLEGISVANADKIKLF